jgi:hypothetical protein
MCRFMYVLIAGAFVAGLAVGCGNSDGETEADRVGVGAECSDAAECESADEEVELECLTQFKGGYCGLEGCAGDVDCPDGSACVTHDDGNNYCFRVCQDKPDCNLNRSVENAANCVGSITFVDDRNDRKACEPPSSGL